MNRRVAAALGAAGLLGGVGVVAFPQHGASIARLATATLAVVVGALVLGAVVPVAARSPAVTALDRPPSPGARPLDPPGLRDARRDLARPVRQGWLPTAVQERLALVAAIRLHHHGVDVDDDRGAEEAQVLLGPETWRLLTGTAPTGGVSDTDSVAGTVHRILAQLDRLADPPGARHVHR